MKPKKTFDDLPIPAQILVIILGIPLTMACFVAKGFLVGIGLILAYQYFF